MAAIPKGFWIGLGSGLALGAVLTVGLGIAWLMPREAGTGRAENAASIKEGWLRSESVSRLDATKVLQFSRLSSEFYIDGVLHRARLVVGCEKGAVVAAIDWSVPVSGEMGRQWIMVRHRVDKGPLQESVWSTSSIPTASIAREPGQFVQSMIGAREVIAGVQPPFTQSEIETSFDASGFATPAAEIRKACARPA